MEINTKKTDYWRIVFVASALGAVSVLSKSAASGFSLKISPAVLTALSAAILNPLENLGASNIEWFDTEFYENAVESKVRYTTGKTDRIGYGFLYHREKHYEFCIFLPHTKNFSADFLEKIRTSIRLPIRNSSIIEGE